MYPRWVWRRPPRKDDRREDGYSLEYLNALKLRLPSPRFFPGLLLCPSATRRPCRYQPCSHFKSDVSAPGAPMAPPIYAEAPSADLIHGACGTDPDADPAA